jgi:hypothetical protein
LLAAAERDSDIGHTQKGSQNIVKLQGGGASRLAPAAFVFEDLKCQQKNI